MRGFPKHLNTKADYLYIRENFLRKEWLPHFQALLDTMKDWFFVEELPVGKMGVADDTHKVEESKRYNEETQAEETTYLQYELRENPNCKLYRIGFTVEEVERLMQ